MWPFIPMKSHDQNTGTSNSQFQVVHLLDLGVTRKYFVLPSTPRERKVSHSVISVGGLEIEDAAQAIAVK